MYGATDAGAVSFIRTSAGVFTTLPWRNSGSYTPFLLGALNDSRNFTLWGDPVLYHSDGSSAPITYPAGPVTIDIPTFSLYSLNDAGSIAGSASYPHDGTPELDIPFVHPANAGFSGVYCDGTVPLDHIAQTGWLPVTISRSGKVGGYFDSEDTDGARVRTAFIATPRSGTALLALSKNRLTFPPTFMFDAKKLPLTLTNVGSIPIQIGSLVAADDRDFNVAFGTCTRDLAPRDNCDIEVTFPFAYAPQAGPVPGYVLISDSSENAPHYVELHATAVTPELDPSRTSWNFAAHDVGEQSGLGTIWIYNPKPLAIPLLGPAVVGMNPGEFSVASNTRGQAIGAYKTCAVRFYFKPIAPGERYAILQMATNIPNAEPNLSVSVSLSGLGKGKILKFSSTTWDFGAHSVGRISVPSIVYIYTRVLML